MPPRNPGPARPTSGAAPPTGASRPGRPLTSAGRNAPWQLLALPSALLLFFWPVIAGRRFFWEDIVQQFYPSLSYLVTSLREFRLPYWSPYVFSGIPFINDIQTQTFYPPNWLLLPFVGADGRLSFYALEILIILHLLAAGLFMYRLLREWSATPRAALFGAMVFMLSGFMVLRTIHLGVIYTYTWFPLLFLLFCRSLSRRRIHLALAGALVFALAALGGYPQTLLHMSYGLALYALFHIARNWRGQRFESVARGFGGLALIVIIGLGLAAVQYLPSSQYVQHTLRTSLSYTDLVEASLRPVQLLTLLVPKFFGSVSGDLPARTDSVQFWLGGYAHNYWETVIYIGIFPLLMALFALTDRRQTRRWFLAVLAALALVLALGRYTPLYRVALAVLPGFDRFRIPGRLSDLFTFGMTALAAFGADYFLRRGSEAVARSLLKVLLFAVGLGALLWVLFATGGFKGLAQPFQDSALYANSVGQWGRFMVLLVLAAALIFFRRLPRFSPDLVFWGLLGITFIDLALFGSRFNAGSTSPNEYPFVRGESIERLRQESRIEPFRISMRNERAMLLGRNQGNLDRLELLEGYTPLGLARYAPFVKPNPAMLDLLNTRYRVDSLGRSLLPNPGCLPRARMLYRYQLVPSESAAAEIVRRGEFDYRSLAIVESDPGFAASLNESVPNRVSITRRRAEHLAFEVETGQTGILVLSEVFYPEWKARLDGRPVSVYPVDYALRGVTIPAGTHVVEMDYDPTRVRQGAAVSVVTLLLTVGFITFLRRQRPGSGPRKAVDSSLPAA